MIVFKYLCYAILITCTKCRLAQGGPITFSSIIGLHFLPDNLTLVRATAQGGPIAFPSIIGLRCPLRTVSDRLSVIDVIDYTNERKTTMCFTIPYRVNNLHIFTLTSCNDELRSTAVRSAT